jgi:hypothetical protein
MEEVVVMRFFMVNGKELAIVLRVSGSRYSNEL